MKNIKDIYIAFGIIVISVMVLISYITYGQLYIKYYQNKLIYNEEINVDAAKILAKEGKRVHPYIKRCLMSNDVQLVKGACSILLFMNESWEEALDVLISILKKPPSAIGMEVASLIYIKRYGFKLSHLFGVELTTLPKDSNIILNLCIYIMLHGKGNEQEGCILKLLDYCSKSILPYLVRKLDTTKNNQIKCDVITAIGYCTPQGHPVVDRIINILLNDTDVIVKSSAAEALGRIKDPMSLRALINSLENDDSQVRESAANAIGFIADNSSASKLLNVLNLENNYNVKRELITALGNIKAVTSMPVLIGILSDNSPVLNNVNYIRKEILKERAALALSTMKCKECIDVLIKQFNEGNEYFEYFLAIASFETKRVINELKEIDTPPARLALLWITGEEREIAETYFREQSTSSPRTFYRLSKARWGCVESLVWLFQEDFEADYLFRAYFIDIFNRMPTSFPICDYHSARVDQDEKIKQIKEWFTENYKYLNWNAIKRVYDLNK